MVVQRALRAMRERRGFRVVHYSTMSNHLHLLVEATDGEALSRGMQGLTIRIARGLNRLWRRSGKVFGDRFHSRPLRTPREVRNALAYVLCNARRHGVRAVAGWLDPYSSAAGFDGWKRSVARPADSSKGETAVARARTWLLSKGWRRRGLLDPRAVPG